MTTHVKCQMLVCTTWHIRETNSHIFYVYMWICISIQFEWIAYNIWQAKCKSIYLIFVWRKRNKIIVLNFYRKQLKIHRLLFKQINENQNQRERKYVYKQFSQLCSTVSSKLTLSLLNGVHLKFKSIAICVPIHECLLIEFHSIRIKYALIFGEKSLFIILNINQLWSVVHRFAYRIFLNNLILILWFELSCNITRIFLIYQSI